MEHTCKNWVKSKTSCNILTFLIKSHLFLDVCCYDKAGDAVDEKDCWGKKYDVWQRSCSRSIQRASWTHHLYLSHKDTSALPFEDYIWLGDQFHRGEWEAVYQRDKSEAVVEIYLAKWDACQSVAKIRHVQRCDFCICISAETECLLVPW